MKKIFNVITTVLIVILALFLVFNTICFVKRQRGDQCPTVLGLGMAVVITGSMEPNIGVDDLVVFWHQDSYSVREVVTYRGDSYPVTHRVVGVRTDENGNVWYTTQGDVNNKDDGEIAADRVVGKVIMVIPNVGNLQRFLQSSNGFILVTVIAVLLIAVGELRNIIGKRR